MQIKLKDRVKLILDGIKNIFLISNPLPYQDFLYIMMNSNLIVTDSGGIQEEAPSFKTPVLIFREHTERIEAVDAGCAKIIGTTTQNLTKSIKNF